MPIKPENKNRYPKNWTSIRQDILCRAGNRCEGSPSFPDCRAVNHHPHPVTGSRVVLTIAHLNHTPEDCRPENLRAWCQRCHLKYDQDARIAERKQKLDKEKTTMTRTELLQLHDSLTQNAKALMERKNADYGANHDPFANFRMSALLHLEPEKGVLLRMQDKMARLVSFTEKGNLAVTEESWKDSIIDIINYSVLLCGLLEEKIDESGAKKS